MRPYEETTDETIRICGETGRRTMKTGDKIGELARVSVGLYVGSACGRCGYGLNKAKNEAVALLSSAGVLDGETLCFRCFAAEIGDPRSATHRV